MSKNEVFAVILAGGTGSRLWPLSRVNLPKQFLTLDGDATMLQTTINRLSPLIKSVLIVTQEAHAKGAITRCWPISPCSNPSDAILRLPSRWPPRVLLLRVMTL